MLKTTLFPLCLTFLLSLPLPETAQERPSSGAQAVATRRTGVCHGFVVKQDKLADKISNAKGTQLSSSGRISTEVNDWPASEGARIVLRKTRSFCGRLTIMQRKYSG